MIKVKTVTSREIMSRCAIQNVKTLTRWHQRGLIPPPDVVTHPDGRGKIGLWPAWVLRRCLQIRQLLHTGHGLDKIAELLGNDWKAEAKRWSRPYRFADVAKQLDHDAAVANFRDLAWNKMASFLGSGRKNVSAELKKADDQLSTLEIVEDVVRLVQEGIRPVLIFDGDLLEVSPDFMLAQRLAQPAGGAPFVVVPVFEEAYVAFSPVIPDLPKQPTLSSVARLVAAGKRKQKEYQFKPIGGSDFRIVEPS